VTRRRPIWIRDFWTRVPWLWLLVLLLLGLFLVDAFVPVPNSASEATRTLRTGSVTLLGSLLVGLVVGLVVYAVQSERTRRDRHREVLRGAYALLLKSAQRIDDLNQQLRGTPRLVESLSPDPVRTLGAEAEELHFDAEVALILEEGVSEPALDAWDAVLQSYNACAKTRHLKGDPETVKSLERKLDADIVRLRLICHQRLRALG
jgi:hypothetical protein